MMRKDPPDHPLRPMRMMVDQALESIPPERLLRALLVQILFSIRSERQLIGHLEYNLLYRWFTENFVADCRSLHVTPHVAQNTSNRASRIDGRTTRHAGYSVSQRRRKQVEEVFGWMKTAGLVRKVRHRGREKVDWVFVFTAAAYDLVRLRGLAAVPT